MLRNNAKAFLDILQRKIVEVKSIREKADSLAKLSATAPVVCTLAYLQRFSMMPGPVSAVSSDSSAGMLSFKLYRAFYMNVI